MIWIEADSKEKIQALCGSNIAAEGFSTYKDSVF